jgi:hypothetical protein
MGFTTNRTTPQMAAVLVTAGALPDQALTVLHSDGWRPNFPQSHWGVLVQATGGWKDGIDSVWEYDLTPSFAGHTNQTLAQAAAALVTAGALADQATAAVHSLAWTPNRAVNLWGVFVQCTSGWNSGAPVFQYSTSPS